MKIFYSIILVLLVAGAIGWCMNIYKLVNCDFESPYKAEFIRAVGLMPPVGAVVGWVDIEDGKKESK